MSIFFILFHALLQSRSNWVDMNQMNIINIDNRASVGRETKDFSELLSFILGLELFDEGSN